MKRIMLPFITLILLFSSKAFASDFTLYGDPKGLAITQVGDLSKLSNLLPGETQELGIYVENTGNDPYKLYMKVVDLNPDKANPLSFMDPDHPVSNGDFAQTSDNPLQMRIFLDNRQITTFPVDRTGYADNSSTGYALLGLIQAKTNAYLTASFEFMGESADQNEHQESIANMQFRFIAEFADSTPTPTSTSSPKPTPTTSPRPTPTSRPYYPYYPYYPPAGSVSSPTPVPQSSTPVPQSPTPVPTAPPYNVGGWFPPPDDSTSFELEEPIYVEPPLIPGGAPILVNATPSGQVLGDKIVPKTGEAPLWMTVCVGATAIVSGMLLLALVAKKRKEKIN